MSGSKPHNGVNCSAKLDKFQTPTSGIANHYDNRKIKLPNVTLVAMATRNVEETLQALVYSCKGVEFGSVKLLSIILLMV